MYIYRYTFYFIQLLNKIVNKTYLCRSIYYTVLYKFYVISSILFKNQFKKNLNVANLPNTSIGVFCFNICPIIGSVMVSYSICLRFGMNPCPRIGSIVLCFSICPRLGSVSRIISIVLCFSICPRSESVELNFRNWKRDFWRNFKMSLDILAIIF